MNAPASASGANAVRACPTMHGGALRELSLALDGGRREFVRRAGIQGGSGYAGKDRPPARPVGIRLKEIARFARRMGCTKPGPAFCTEWRAEAGIIDRSFASRGFTMVSAGCKVGRVRKSAFGLTRGQRAGPDREKPHAQPDHAGPDMNGWKVDFNFLGWFCVGRGLPVRRLFPLT